MTTIWSIIQSWIESKLGERKVNLEKTPGLFQRIFAFNRGIQGGH